MAVTQTVRSRRGQLGLRAVSAPVVERFQISQCSWRWWGTAVGMPSVGQWQDPILRRGRRRRYGQLHHVQQQLHYTHILLYYYIHTNEAKIMDRSDYNCTRPCFRGKIPACCITDFTGNLISRRSF